MPASAFLKKGLTSVVEKSLKDEGFPAVEIDIPTIRGEDEMKKYAIGDRERLTRPIGVPRSDDEIRVVQGECGPVSRNISMPACVSERMDERS